MKKVMVLGLLALGILMALVGCTKKATVAANPHVPGANCTACHAEEHKRWANSLHAADAAAVLMNEEHNKAELLTDECITCHAPFQAAKFHVGDFVQPLDKKGPWKLVSANAAQWQAISCSTCHDVRSKSPAMLAFFDPAKSAYVSVKDGVDLCEKCHQAGTDDSRDLKGSVHEGLQCAACHVQKATAMGMDPKGSCATCHPGANPKHPDVTKLETTFKSSDSKNNIHFVSCTACHTKGVPGKKT
jgi:hypothetical protein